MGEGGLIAIHKIISNINDQDESIWRQTAAKKCLKKEIEKLEEQTKRYEMQMVTLKKDPLQEKGDKVTQSLEDNVKNHLQTHKLLSLALNARSEEIDRKTEDIKSWELKYKEAIAELKEAYDIKKTLYESINPMYKTRMEINASQKLAEVRLKQLKASSEKRRRSQNQLRVIKKEIFLKTIINFANAVLRRKKYDELNGSKLKVLEEKRKDMVRDLFEAQEALKKHRVSRTKITSGMFTKRIPNLNMQQEITKRNEKRSISELLEINKAKRLGLDKSKSNLTDDSKISDELNLEEENTKPISFPTPKRKPLLPTNRINILSNKILSLPPLKTILTKQRSRLDSSNRSFGDVSFNRSQNSQVNSQPGPVKQLDSTIKLSQESQVQSEHDGNVRKVSLNTNQEEPSSAGTVNIPKPSDYLKNLKFTLKSDKFDTQNKPGASRIQNSRTSQTQQTSILKSQACKRKLNESVQDVDLETTQRKKDKNVNFASPIQQNIEINQVSTPDGTSLNLSSPMSISSNRNMNAALEGNMWMSPPKKNNDEFKMGQSSFSFAQPNETQSKNDFNMAQGSMFGDANNAEPSFGFCFGGSSKASGGMWDLFG